MPLAPRKDSAQATLPPPQAAAPEAAAPTNTAPIPAVPSALPPIAALITKHSPDAPSTLASAPAAGSKPKIKAIRAGFGQELTAYDQKLQRQIHRAGVWQAAVQCQAIVQYAGDFEAYKKLVRELANEGIAYTEE